MWGESVWGWSGAEAPCGVRGAGAEGRSAVKVRGVALGKSPRVGCEGLGLERGRIPLWSCVGGRQPGGT